MTSTGVPSRVKPSVDSYVKAVIIKPLKGIIESAIILGRRGGLDDKSMDKYVKTVIVNPLKGIVKAMEALGLGNLEEKPKEEKPKEEKPKEEKPEEEKPKEEKPKDELGKITLRCWVVGCHARVPLSEGVLCHFHKMCSTINCVRSSCLPVIKDKVFCSFHHPDRWVMDTSFKVVYDY